MRDVSKVFQGLYKADKNFYEGPEHIVKLWAHEVLRVFQDRLISQEDRDKLKGFVNEQLEVQLSSNYQDHCTTNGEDPVFVDFLTESSGEPVYQEVTNYRRLKEYLQDKLEEYNT